MIQCSRRLVICLLAVVMGLPVVDEGAASESLRVNDGEYPRVFFFRQAESWAANKRISELRAASVMMWLVSHGIDKGRLSSAGLGGEQPIESNDSEVGRALNRRIELHIETK